MKKRYEKCKEMRNMDYEYNNSGDNICIYCKEEKKK